MCGACSVLFLMGNREGKPEKQEVQEPAEMFRGAVHSLGAHVRVSVCVGAYRQRLLLPRLCNLMQTVSYIKKL